MKKSQEQPILTNTPEEVSKAKTKMGRKPGIIYFPRNSLMEARRIATAIWKIGSGKPAALGDISEEVGYSPMSSSFRELVRSAERYGLTEGTWRQNTTSTIFLSTLGTTIVAPQINEDVNKAMRNALETPEVFREFLHSINGKAIPAPEVFKSTLIRNHHLSKDDADVCYKVLMKNIEELKLSKESAQGKAYLRLDRLSVDEVSREPGAQVESETMKEDTETESETTKPVAKEQIQEIVKPHVFISHSKNKKILEQIKEMLKFGNFDYEIAEERETTSIPIPDKIFGLMRACNCAVINISADEQEKRDGTYGINQNVLIEIGAAFLAYNKSVILLVDRRIKLPSNLQGLSLSYYDGDELSWETGMKLQKALTEFRAKL